MNDSFENYARDVMSGSAKGPRATALRAGLSLAEPCYATAMRVRNRMFDFGIRKTHKLARPVISVGNITTGGTGKTPMVRWLAENLRGEGRRIAILSRGYGAETGQLGDELTMLDRMLNEGSNAPVWVRAHPDRVAAADALVREHPEIDVFILDDGFQHRRVGRDLDIVLINAAAPFGFGHVLPRGMLREPLSGLRRADAIVLTHVDHVSEDERIRIEQTIRNQNPFAPIYRTCHVHTGLRSSGSSSALPPARPIAELSTTPFYAFAGIGSPDLLGAQLQSHGSTYVGRRWFPDHHAYTEANLSELRSDAERTGARMLVTTEKDWVKIERLPRANVGLPIHRIELSIRFVDDKHNSLVEQVRQRIAVR